MDGLRQSRAAELVREILPLTPEQRRARLDEECNGDAALRAEIESRCSSEGGDTEAPTVVSEAATAVTMAQSPEVVHRKIGPYRVVHELGRGGMGVVYLGVRETDQFKRRVAIKLLKKGMDTEDVLRRFELERQLLASLNHPGIARLFDAGETDDGMPYFAMEYVEGIDISDYCDTHRLDIEERLELFSKVCAAVHHAHQNLVVHRDLKPSNIIVTEDGQPKLLDFGIAKILNPDLALIAGDPTAPELRVMTPEYASPEQVRGLPITTASDVYSLGVLLYQLVTGHAPYRLASRVRDELERVICTEDPERPSTAVSRIAEISRGGPTPTTSTVTPESVSQTRGGGRPDRLRKRLTGDVDNIVLMAMRKEPQRRYQSAQQMAEDIDRHKKGLPVIARPDTLSYRASKFVSRNRLGVGAAAVVAITLIGGIIGTASGMQSATKGWNEAKDARDAEQAQRIVAETERDRADRRFDEVRSLAHTFMFDFHDAIVTLDGSLEARELLVTTALEYLDALRKEVGSRPDLEQELAAAYERVGDIRGGNRGPSLGDLDGAKTNYDTALEIRRALVAATPGDAKLKAELSNSLMRTADVLLLQGDVGASLADHQESLALREDILAAKPTDATAREDVAVAAMNVGAALMASGDGDGAIEQYERSLEIRRTLATEKPNDPKLQREISVACLRVGGRLADAGRHDDALVKYLEAAEIRRRLVTADPFSTRADRDLGVAQYFVGSTLLALRRPAEAMEPLEEYLETADARVKANPRSARAKRDLALAHDILGQALKQAGNIDGAIEHFRSFQTMIGALAAAEPTNTQYGALLAGSHERLGGGLAAAGNFKDAAEHGRQAITILQTMVDEASDDVRRQEELARGHLKLGSWLAEDGRRGEAIRHLESARERFGVMRESDPKSASIRKGLVDALHELSRLMAGIDDRDAAVRYAREAIANLDGAEDGESVELRAALEGIVSGDGGG